MERNRPPDASRLGRTGVSYETRVHRIPHSGQDRSPGRHRSSALGSPLTGRPLWVVDQAAQFQEVVDGGGQRHGQRGPNEQIDEE